MPSPTTSQPTAASSGLGGQGQCAPGGMTTIGGRWDGWVARGSWTRSGEIEPGLQLDSFDLLVNLVALEMA